ncbi:hypothetical protein PROP_02665 [Propionicimonas sp. T2.31MG-18]|uniref:PTS sugar transporter subunit IIA n=1 Tax=Propionicimonas sp. T2.31MG-18 TaxID=3157620 RepID=UPI0035E5E213
MLQVLSPCPGRAFPITEADDPVFAQELVGPGVAIEPLAERTTVVAPVAGTILKLHPHAFAMATADGLGVLVHLGINTVKLAGAGFELLAAEGATVAAGDPMVSWNPAEISGEGITTTVLVVALDRPAGSLDSPATGDVATGQTLFEIDA